MLLINRWIRLLTKVALGSWKIKIVLAPIAGMLFLSAIGLFIYLSFLLDQFLRFPRIFSNPINSIIGILLCACGFVLMFASIIQFLKAKGTPVPLSPPPTLVRSGLYQYARNPMLTGIFILLFGLGVFAHSVSLIFIFTPLFIACNIWELKMIEEPELEKRLGKAYRDYKKQVPMFFPWLKK